MLMSILTVDMVDKSKVAVSYEDGTTAVYEEQQLKRLPPTQIEHDKPGVGPRSSGEEPTSRNGPRLILNTKSGAQ